MARSGWIAVLITALMVGALGSEPLVDQVSEVDAQLQPLLGSLTAFPSWSPDSFGGGSDIVGPIVAKVVVLLVVVFIGGGLASQGGSTASFLAGWGALMVAAALSGGVFLAAADAFAFDGTLADSAGGAVPLVTGGINDGVQFGLYTGWLVGLGVALMSRDVRIEPRWEEPVTDPSAPGSAPGYPTIYPRLPSGSDWSGPAPTGTQATAVASYTNGTGATPAATAGYRPRTAPPTAPVADGYADATEPEPAPSSGSMWPGSWASPSSRRRSSRSSGAYTQGDDEADRPSWTRWSGR